MVRTRPNLVDIMCLSGAVIYEAADNPDDEDEDEDDGCPGCGVGLNRVGAQGRLRG